MIVCRRGEAARDRVPVTSHALDIPDRIRAVLPTAFVMANRRTGRFEIHDSAQAGSTLACVLPYDALDARAVEHVRRYRVERMEAILREVGE